MKDRFNILYGSRSTKDFNDVFTDTRVPSGLDILNGIQSIGGASRRAKPQAYHRYYESYLRGVIATTLDSGQSETLNGVYTAVQGSPSAYYDSTAYNRALESLYEQIRGNVDLSIDLYQIRQTQATVIKLARVVTRAAETLRSIRRSRPRDWGSQWLEYVYGIKPSLQTAFELVDKMRQPEKLFYIIKARGKSGDRRVVRADLGFPGGTIERATVFEDSTRVEIACRFALSGSALESLAGFASLNPVSFLWEAMPYSFVVDWAVNFGGYLRCMESAFLYGQSFVDGYVTRTSRSLLNQTIYGSSQIGSVNYSYSVNGFAADIIKNRSILDSVPFPELPKFKPTLGATRLLNAAALLSQHLR